MKILNSTCKDCGEEIAIAEQAVVNEVKRGFSRPERCISCRIIHSKEINNLGSSHFTLKSRNRQGKSLGSPYLGEINHGNRFWSNNEYKKSHEEFDEMRAKIGMRDDHEVKDLYKKLSENQVVIAVAPTGTGKSTYLPYILLEPIDLSTKDTKSINVIGNSEKYRQDQFTALGPIVVCQPRVQAAIGISQAVAKKLYGTPTGPGFLIGHKVGKRENKVKGGKEVITDNYDRFTKLIYITDGSLKNWIIQGKAHEFSIIILDEAHERTVAMDAILMLLKRELIKYPHLKLIITSATIDPKEFVNYYSDVTTVGECDFTEARAEFLYEKFFHNEKEFESNEILQAIPEKIISVFERPKKYKDGKKAFGHILAFLPGKGEISFVHKALEEKLKGEKIEIIDLYSGCNQEDLDNTSTEKKGIRKIYLATNIAETSLTFKNLEYVIESGLIKTNKWIPSLRRFRLEVEWHSQAGIKQRWGRVGRGQIGWVYTMYSEDQFNSFLPYSQIDIEKENLEDLLLQLSLAGISNFEDDSLWVIPPRKEELDRCLSLFNSRKLITKTNLHSQVVSKYGEEIKKAAIILSRSLENIIPGKSIDTACFLVLCEKFGCLVEGATITSMLCFMGRNMFLKTQEEFEEEEEQGIIAQKSNMFKWNDNWTYQEKISFSNKFYAFQNDCIDDIDFALKLYYVFEQDRINNTKILESYNFDIKVFDTANERTLSIKGLRKNILTEFQRNATDKTIPPLNLKKIGLCRLLMSIAWNDEKLKVISKNLFQRGNDLVLGVANNSSLYEFKSDDNIISGYHEKRSNFIYKIAHEQNNEGGFKQVPEYGFTSSFLAFSSSQLPNQIDYLSIFDYYRKNKATLKWLNESKFNLAAYENFDNVNPETTITGTIFFRNHFDPTRINKLIAVELRSSSNESVFIDSLEFETLFSSTLRLSENIPIPTHNLNGQITTIPYLLDRIDNIDLDRRYKGKIVGFKLRNDQIYIKIESYLLPNEAPFLFEIHLNSMRHINEELNIGDSISFFITLSFRSWHYSIKKSKNYYFDVLNDNIVEMEKFGFTTFSIEDDEDIKIYRTRELTNSDLMYVAKSPNKLKKIFANYLKRRFAVDIDLNSIESELTLKSNSRIINSLKKCGNKLNSEIESLLKNNNEISTLFKNQLRDLKGLVGESIRNIQYRKNKLNREISIKEGNITYAYINISENRKKLATAWKESFRMTVQSWIDAKQMEIAVSERQIEMFKRERDNLDLNVNFNSEIDSYLNDLNKYDKITYSRKYYLKNSDGRYLILLNNKFRSLTYGVKESIVQIESSYFSKRNEKIQFNRSGNIVQGQEMAIELTFPREVILKNKFQKSNLPPYKIKREQSEKIALFKVQKINERNIHIKTNELLSYGLEQELVLEVCE